MTARPQSKPLVLYTIGHSTRPLPAFIELLQLHKVKQLVDVRTIPRSQRNPQFNIETLPEALHAAGIRYVHLPALGGLRHARRDSPNRGWRNESFRGFADYMQQPEFGAGIDRLMKRATARSTAIMCAEAVPWRCHRSLVADALAVRGARVEHILSGQRTKQHTLIPFAHVEGKQITYPEVRGPQGSDSPKGNRSPRRPARHSENAFQELAVTPRHSRSRKGE